MEKNEEKAPQQNRMEQDVQNTSRTMKPAEAQDKNSNPTSSITLPQGGSSTTTQEARAAAGTAI